LSAPLDISAAIARGLVISAIDMMRSFIGFLRLALAGFAHQRHYDSPSRDFLLARSCSAWRVLAVK
ncbi:MAG: hypothetical protein WAM53_11270, partial [Terrimicrobiaceae bacterium]